VSDTVTLRYVGPARRFRAPAFDIDVVPGETVTVDATRDVLIRVDADDTEHTQSLPAFLTGRHGFERVPPGDTAVLDGPVDDVQATVATGAHDGHLAALAHAEREGQNRSTALEAIHARQRAISDEADKADERASDGGDG
jgi:hypothetical protein